MEMESVAREFYGGDDLFTTAVMIFYYGGDDLLLRR
jgi:hypothetical protein